MPGKNHSKENQSNLFVERDVLGQEKVPANPTASKASPNKIFIAIVAAIVIAIVAWLVTNH